MNILNDILNDKNVSNKLKEVFKEKKGKTMTSKWLTKYQMEGLQDGEYYNVRNKKVYVKDDQDNYVLTYSDFELEKVQDYNTNQLMFFFDEIEREWCKTNELHSMTDLLEIHRELTIREINQ